MAIRVQRADFDAGTEIDRLTAGRTDIGAVVSFIGLVRDMAGSHTMAGGHPMAGGQPIRGMVLEHYPGMTEKQLEAIEAEAHARWPLDGSTIIHRYGSLAPGERIVLVVTASAHRKAAFEAAEFLMDWLKTKAPFWKSETTQEGSHWVEAKAGDEEAASRWE